MCVNGIKKKKKKSSACYEMMLLLLAAAYYYLAIKTHLISSSLAITYTYMSNNKINNNLNLLINYLFIRASAGIYYSNVKVHHSTS